MSEENAAAASSDEPLILAASAKPAEVSENVSKKGLGISEIFHSITAEHIILLAAILILWDSRADDGLMIMLAVLLFC